MADLFSKASDAAPDAATAAAAPRPLADRLRPARLGDVIGQQALLGPEGPLGAMLAATADSSMAAPASSMTFRAAARRSRLILPALTRTGLSERRPKS
jgi:hypothetical protein